MKLGTNIMYYLTMQCTEMETVTLPTYFTELCPLVNSSSPFKNSESPCNLFFLRNLFLIFSVIIENHLQVLRNYVRLYFFQFENCVRSVTFKTVRGSFMNLGTKISENKHSENKENRKRLLLFLVRNIQPECHQQFLKGRALSITIFLVIFATFTLYLRTLQSLLLNHCFYSLYPLQKCILIKHTQKFC